MTTEGLNSAKAAGTVRSFVSTSSRIASFNPDGSAQKVSGKDWFDEAPFMVAKVPEEAKPMMIYAASKVAGEKAI